MALKTCKICGKITEYFRCVPRPDMKKVIVMCWDCIQEYCVEQVMKPTPDEMCCICKVNKRVNSGIPNKEWTLCQDCFAATAIID